MQLGRQGVGSPEIGHRGGREVTPVAALGIAAPRLAGGGGLARTRACGRRLVGGRPVSAVGRRALHGAAHPGGNPGGLEPECEHRRRHGGVFTA